MSDGPNIPASSAPGLPALRRRRVWPFVAGAAVLGVVVALGWWALAGSKFWTDGAGLHLSDSEARVREVAWTTPIPLTIFNTTDQEYEPSLSPDGEELYFVRGKAGQIPEPGRNADIYVSYRRMGQWAPAVPVDAVNSDYDDLGPRVTADNKFLLFYSNRPGGLGGYDIWAAQRLPSDGTKPGGWGKPFNLGPGVNSEFDEYNPDPSPDGKRLFFATNRTAAARKQKQAWKATIRADANPDFDIWYAARDETAEAAVSGPSSGATTNPTTQPLFEGATQPSDEIGSEVKPLVAKPQAAQPALVFTNPIEVPGINTPFAEGASCMSPAGDFLYFASDRPGGYGKLDIYRCRVGADGTFGLVENLGPAINTSDNETDPQLALNGFRLYFSSDRRVGDSTGSPGSTGSPQAGSPQAGSQQATATASTQPSGARARATDNGDYALLQSDSHEVYSMRAGHRLPHLSLSWLIMVLSLLALIPLVMFMRKWDDQRLSLLQKCLLVSLLVHVLITLGLSMKKVTTDVIHYVRQEQGIEPPIDLTLTSNGPPGKGEDVGAAVRQQTSSDLPVTSAPPAAVVQQQPGAVALDAPTMPAGMQALPQAALGAPGVMIQVQAPKIETPKMDSAAQAPQVAPSVAPQTPGLDLKIAAVPHVSQAEANAQAAAAAVQVARIDLGQIGIQPKIDVPQVNAAEKSAPAAVEAGSMVESAATVRPVAPPIETSTPQAVTPPSETSVAVATPHPIAAPVVSHAPEAPPIQEVANAAARQAASAIESAAKPVAVQPAVPTAQTLANSLASDTAAHAMPTPAEVAAGAANPAKVSQPDAGSVAQVNDLAAPKAPAEKVTGTEAAAVAEAVAGIAKQGAPNATNDIHATGAANVAGATSQVPTAQAVTDSLAGAAAAHAASVQTAVANAAPAPARPDVPANADLSVRPASPLPGSAAGPLSSNRPDSPQAAEMLAGASRAGEAQGSGGPTTVPTLAVSAAPSRDGSGQSLASAPAPIESVSVGPAASSPAVQPTASPNLAAGPAVAAGAVGSGPKVVSAGQPDAPTAAEAAGALARHGLPDATTQPTLADANLSGVAGAKVPTVRGAAQSLVSAPDAGSPASVAAGAASQNLPSIAAGSVQSPAGNVDVATRSAGAVQRTAEAQPNAAEASSLSAGPAARQSSDNSATALAEAAPHRLSLPALPAETQKGPAGIASAVAPTTRPLDTSSAVALARESAVPGRGLKDFSASPEVGSPITTGGPVSGAREASVAARAADVNAGPRKIDAGPTASAAGAAAALDPAAPPTVAAGVAGKPGSPGASLASAAAASPREVVAGPVGKAAGATMSATPVVAVAGPKMELPKVAAAPTPTVGVNGSPHATGAGEAGSIAVSRAQPTPGGGDGRPVPGVMLASAGVPGISAVTLSAGNDPASKSLDSTASKTLPRTVSGPPVVAPEVTVAVPKLAAPESLFQRSPEQRKPLVEKRGGTPESEGAVERALAYLSRQQEPDGRWTVFNDDGRPGRRGRHPHDMACTGLATLAFLTADNTPAKDGPYRETVTRSIEFLIDLESPNGDMRGPRQFRGGGADQGNMYDQGICTMALCEAALMTGDRRYTDAALRAAQFIVKAQNPDGGWRYTPAEAGDTSVLGWQMLALHDAEQLGFRVPEQVKPRAEKYLKSASQGNSKILAGYMPGEGATSAMTAEALFSRLLLGEEITGPQTKEVCAFLTREMPNSGSTDFYFWYYASLSLSQMPDLIKAGPQANGPEEKLAADTWKKWNAQTRDTLIKMQRKEGPGDGSWSDTRWGERGGRVFSTALATLTLEVYYRYLPLKASLDTDQAAPDNDPRRAAAELKANKPQAGNARNRTNFRGKSWDDGGGHYPGVEPN